MPFLVKDLIEGRSEPVTVSRDHPAKHALELMIEHDFYQLPVVAEDKRPLGMITNDSILRSLNYFDVKLDALRVTDALEKPRVFRDDGDLFDLLDDLRERYAVLIVDGGGILTGIVTSYDTTEYFRRHSEDMMLVEDIETTLKDYIRIALGAEEDDDAAVREAITEITSSKGLLRKKYEKAVWHLFNLLSEKGKPDPQLIDETFAKHLEDDAPAKEFKDLTLNEYIDLFLHPNRWSLYEPVFSLERGAIRKLLDDVRKIRNRLFHFSGDLDTRQRVSLRFCAEWLNGHQRAVEEAFSVKDEKKPTSAATDVVTPEPQGDTAPLEEQPDARESRYAPLAAWLQALPADQDSVELTFEEVERIIGVDLPLYARRHRSWWANDSVSRVQSQQWLNAGWRTSRVDMTEEKVVFSRITDQKLAYIQFFSALMNELRHNTDLPVWEARPDGRNWHYVARLPDENPHSSFLAFAFTRDKRFRVELYVDTGDAQKNKIIFDSLHRNKDEIEGALGQELSWERLDGKRASRVALYKEGSIADEDADLKRLQEWALPAMIKFRAVISEHLPDDV